MMLLVHILVAFISIGYSSFTYISPSQKKITFSYLLSAGTLGSGTLLLLLNPSHLVSACLSGIAYLGVVLFLILSAKNKLAREESK